MSVAGASVLVTGGAGFIGCNLVDRLARDGHRVRVLDALLRPGVEENLRWLRRRHGQAVTPMIADVRDAAAVREATDGVDAVFHLAAQVAVTTSLDAPMEDFEVNLRGTLNVLEAVRRRPVPPPVIFASTNKVYGGLEDVTLATLDGAWLPADAALRAAGIDEARKLDFHTPYGCSKGAADQYVLDYARSFDVPACVLRMSCIYGPHQRGTEDQGWLAHFLYAIQAGRPITIYGDGHQVRDVLFVDDAVEAYVSALANIDGVSGQAFNLGGGPANAVTLRQVLDELAAVTGRAPNLSFAPWRPGDQRWFVADARRATLELGLARPLPWREGLRRLVAWAEAEVPALEVSGA